MGRPDKNSKYQYYNFGFSFVFPAFPPLNPIGRFITVIGRYFGRPAIEKMKFKNKIAASNFCIGG